MTTYDLAHGDDWLAVVDWEPPRAIVYADASNARAWLVEDPTHKVTLPIATNLSVAAFAALARLRERPPAETIPHLEAIALRDAGVPVTEAMAVWRGAGSAPKED